MKIIYPETSKTNLPTMEKKQTIVGWFPRNDVDVEDDTLFSWFFWLLSLDLTASGLQRLVNSDICDIKYLSKMKGLKAEKYGLQPLKIAGRGLGSHGTCSEESPMYQTPRCGALKSSKKSWSVRNT